MREILYFCSGSYHNVPSDENSAGIRFHKFWFLVLENPSHSWGFLVLGVHGF
jgi:hypothetical protein